MEISHDTFSEHSTDGMEEQDMIKSYMDERRPLKSGHHDLPEKLSVLFVDDDPILRKLFARTIKTVAPNWEIREAANGETAVRLTTVEGMHFDLIFMDMVRLIIVVPSTVVVVPNTILLNLISSTLSTWRRSRSKCSVQKRLKCCDKKESRAECVACPRMTRRRNFWRPAQIALH